MIKPKKYIENSQGYPSPMHEDDWVLKLDVNENLIGPSPKVIEAISSITHTNVKYYPVYGELIETIARFNSINNDMILPTNGADEAIKYVIETFITPEDKIITVNPSFAMPKIYANCAGTNFVEVDYEEKWIFPLDSFIKEAKSARMVILTTPNSPTGECISEEYIKKILKNVSSETVVLIDETYSSYAGKSFIKLLDTYENIIIARSMSKDFAIAGLRLGYLISHPQNIEYIRRVASPFSVNIAAAKAGIAALSDVEHFRKVKTEIEKSREILSEGLENMGIKVYPSEANFICADFGNRADFLYKKLLLQGIKIKKFDNEPLLQNHFRIAVPSIEGSMTFLEALQSRDLLIFDMDGVLVDTSNSYRLAIKGVFEHFTGRKLSLEDIQRAKNQGGLNNDWALTEHLLKLEGLNINGFEIVVKFQDFYLGNDFDGFIQNEKLLLSKENIEKLSKNYDLAIFTGRPRKEAFFALRKWGIEKYFLKIITMDDLPVNRQKPNTLGVEEILKVSNPQKVYYLGDTIDDMKCAKNANINGIGVLPPQDKSENLIQNLQIYSPVVILNETEDLMEFLGAEKCEQLKA